MKELRGTLIALVLFLLLGAFFFFRAEKNSEGEQKQIFSFEKHEVVAATISRPDGEVIKLVEREGKWWIDQTKFPANLTMVNRIRHQLHDLEARAKVTTKGDNYELYGLGEGAIRVQLELNGGEKIEFLAGDPNPTGVSYYIRPLPGETVYTVKKSALDYYSAPFDEFRNQHFVSMDTKGVKAFQVDSERGVFRFQRLDERRWELLDPKMRVSKDTMRTMIGRAIALKANRFIDLIEQNQDYGLSNPVLQLQFELESGKKIMLRVGDKAEEDQFSYFQLEGDPVIYVSKNGILGEFEVDPEDLRNLEIMDVHETEVQEISLSFVKENKKIGIYLAGDSWRWENEQPISGSTPDRVSSGLCNLKAMEFTTEDQIGSIIGEVRLKTKDGQERILRVGSPAPSKIVGEEQVIPRRYAQAIRIRNDDFEQEQDNIVIDEYIWSLMKDLSQEWEKKQ